MTTTETDLLRLSRAADTLREHAANATPGPWVYFGPERALTDAELDDGVTYEHISDTTATEVRAGSMLQHPGHYEPHEQVHEVDDSTDERNDGYRIGSAQWMALLGPQIADPLIGLLENLAYYREELAGSWNEHADKLAALLVDGPHL